MKLKKGDTILVVAGKDKGRKGKIEKVDPKEGTVVVLGVNIAKRHLKKRDEKNQGGIVDIAVPMPLSRVQLMCPKCNKPTRVGYIVSEKDKHRICRKCKQPLN